MSCLIALCLSAVMFCYFAMFIFNCLGAFVDFLNARKERRAYNRLTAKEKAEKEKWAAIREEGRLRDWEMRHHGYV